MTYQANALEGKDGGAITDLSGTPDTRAVWMNLNLPDQQGPILRVEEFNMRRAIASHDGRLASEDVDESSQDEGVCDESSRAEFSQVPHKSERQENDHLQENEVLDSQ